MINDTDSMKQAQGDRDRFPLRNGNRKRVDRINLLQLKAKLSKILGPRKERDYCNLFSSFLNHRLSKAELDRQLPQTIGRDNVRLHNQIVRAILYNAICDTDHLKQLSKAPPKVDEPVDDELPALGDGEELEITAPLGVRWSAGKKRRRSHRRWPLVEDLQAEDDPLQLPDNVGMHRRMEKLVVNEEGLQGLNDECALVVNQALDVHLKSLITSCIRLKRSSANNSSNSSSSSSNLQQQQQERISAIDFHLAMSLDSKQLGSNWPVHLERLSLLAFEQQEHRRLRS